MKREQNQIYAPWKVVQNRLGKIAIVDATNNGFDTTSGRVCNLPRENGRGLKIARAICNAINEKYAR
jgi:hypothetical protein